MSSEEEKPIVDEEWLEELVVERSFRSPDEIHEWVAANSIDLNALAGLAADYAQASSHRERHVATFTAFSSGFRFGFEAHKKLADKEEEPPPPKQ